MSLGLKTFCLPADNFFMAETIKPSLPRFGFQVSLLNLTAATAEAAGPSVASMTVNPWKEEAREVEGLVEQYVRVRRRKV